MFISNWKFPDCVHLFSAWARQAVIESIAVASCTNSRKELRRCCSPIGHNNTKHFLCPIRSQHSLDRLEMVRWELVPRGSSACAWKLSSRLFSRLDLLPLGLDRSEDGLVMEGCKHQMKNDGAAVYCWQESGSLTVHNPLSFVHKLWRNNLLRHLLFYGNAI